MNDNIKHWLKALYEGEIENEKTTISNERIWEKGCDDEFNPHTQNIQDHEEYIEVLNNLIYELDFD